MVACNFSVPPTADLKFYHRSETQSSEGRSNFHTSSFAKSGHGCAAQSSNQIYSSSVQWADLAGLHRGCLIYSIPDNPLKLSSTDLTGVNC